LQRIAFLRERERGGLATEIPCSPPAVFVGIVGTTTGTGLTVTEVENDVIVSGCCGEGRSISNAAIVVRRCAVINSSV